MIVGLKTVADEFRTEEDALEMTLAVGRPMTDVADRRRASQYPSAISCSNASATNPRETPSSAARMRVEGRIESGESLPVWRCPAERAPTAPAGARPPLFEPLTTGRRA
jgi:hypothetical protein